MKMPAGHPFNPAREEGGKETTVSLFTYLPVSSFEHHSKGSMSHQVLSAVLKIPHRLHGAGLMATDGQPRMLLSHSENNPTANYSLSPGDAVSGTANLIS